MPRRNATNVMPEKRILFFYIQSLWKLKITEEQQNVARINVVLPFVRIPCFYAQRKNSYSKRNYFFQLEVIILGKLKEIITINLCYRVLTGRRRKAEKSMFFFFSL